MWARWTTLRARGTSEIDVDVVAGVLPEDKLSLVERGQRAGHVMGMTGDGVNERPCPQAGRGRNRCVPATDVAKGAASVVLTDEGLGNVVVAVETGRRVYQRMRTYTLNKIAKDLPGVPVPWAGAALTGSLVTTPGWCCCCCSPTTSSPCRSPPTESGFSPRPERWQVQALSLAALGVAVPWLALSSGTFVVGRRVLGLGLAPVQTLVFVMLVATGQATIYLVRERRHLWASRRADGCWPPPSSIWWS